MAWGEGYSGIAYPSEKGTLFSSRTLKNFSSSGLGFGYGRIPGSTVLRLARSRVEAVQIVAGWSVRTIDERTLTLYCCNTR